VLKVSTRTDATAGRYVVRREGTGFPAEGAYGLGPPFRVPVKLRLSTTRGFRRGLEHAAEPPGRARAAWYATDNGFPSIAAMNDAHRPVLDAAAAALGRRGGNVLDLGCGNGALLEKLDAVAPGVVPFGIDLAPASIEHARALHPGAAEHFVVGDIFDDHWLWQEPGHFALAIVMPGRMLEVGPDRAAALLTRLGSHCDQILVYAYGDWLDRSGGLPALAREAGLLVVDSQHGSAAVAILRAAFPGGGTR